MWIQVFVHSGEALGQAVSPHAGELSVGEQRGGFYRLPPLPPTSPELDDVRIRCLGLDDLKSSGSIIAILLDNPVALTEDCCLRILQACLASSWLPAGQNAKGLK